MSTKLCVYCGLEKEDSEFSDEHIWPEALGGDFLDRATWRTDDVCQKCNGMSGVFVDGSFIKSWFGSAERATGARDYLSVDHPGRGHLPLHYMGRVADVPLQEGEIAEFWLGPCGENIIHFRVEDKEELWASYAGGDPRRGSKKKAAGRAYLSFTSTVDFWVLTTLSSFAKSFRGKRYIVNAALTPELEKFFEVPDASDPIQKADLDVVKAIQDKARNDEHVRMNLVIAVDASSRFLAKLALAIGYKSFGPDFLATPYAATLRQGFREANPAKRRTIQVRGSGYFGELGLSGVEQVLKWPGAWVLLVLVTQSKISLVVISPAGRAMIVLVCEDADLVAKLPKQALDGRVWLTIPALGEAIGPVAFPTYLAHQTGAQVSAELAALAAKRDDPSRLPACR